MQLNNQNVKISIKDVLAQDILPQAKLLAGQNGLDNESDTIVILETPDGLDWLQGNEIVLTSGYAFYNNNNLKENFIYEANKVQAAAICIKEDRYFGPISDRLLTSADECHIPLITLPRETHYSELIANYYEFLFTLKNKDLVKKNQAYYQLLSLQSEDTTIHDITNNLASIIACPVKFVDHYQQEDLMVDPRNVNQQPRRFRKNNEEYVRFVISSKEILAYLDIYLSEKLNDFQVKGINYAISLIKTILLNQQASHWSESELHHTLGLMLDNSNLASSPFELRQIQEIMGWHGGNFQVLCVRYLNSNSSDSLQNANKSKLYKNMRKFLEKSDLGKFTYVEHGNEMLICLNANAEDVQARLRILFVNSRHLKDHINIGVSSIRRDLTTYSIQVQEAQVASWQASSLSFYDSLGLARCLNNFVQSSSSTDLFDHTIQKLVDYDVSNHSKLVDTLKAYFANNMNKTKTAEALYIHPETVRYRLKQIETICDISPYTSDGIFQLMLGLEIKKYRDQNQRGNN